VIATMLSRMLGEHNTTDIERSNLLAPFNEWILRNRDLFPTPRRS
jgi:hypothetical protein